MDRISVYRTKIFEHIPEFDEMGVLYNKLLHLLLNIYKSGIEFNSIKKSFSKEHQISSRWFNTLCVDITGRIDSAKECLKLNKGQKEDSIDGLEKTIKKQLVKRTNLQKIQKRTNKEEAQLKKLDTTIFRKKHRLSVLKHKLDRINLELTYNVPSMCLGSKDLFKKQHHIPNKEYKNISEWQEKDYDGWSEFHSEWKKEWQFVRNNQFYSIGSHDENCGNVSCTPFIQADGKITLRIRIPDCLVKEEKYYHLKDLYFKHGHKEICAAIEAHKMNNGCAMSFRFIKNLKGWEIFATIHVEIPEITIKDGGYIGVDLNNGFLACAVVMKNGNLMNREEGIFRISMDLFGKSSDQATAIIGDVVKKLVEKAKYYNLPICVEDLDFSKKKNSLKNNTGSKKLRHMLSSFVYKKFYSILVSACHRSGIGLKKVNPAFTSLLGRNKFMKMYGISVHHAAAICIARRGMDLGEEIISGKFLKDSGILIICKLPERMAYKNNFSYLFAVQSILQKNLKNSGSIKKKKKETILISPESRLLAGIALASVEWKLISSVGCEA